MGPILHSTSHRQHLAKAKVSFLLQFLSLCKSFSGSDGKSPVKLNVFQEHIFFKEMLNIDMIHTVYSIRNMSRTRNMIDIDILF